MRFSTKTAYGVRVLLDLALHRAEEPIPLRDIAQRQDLPLAYLERLVSPLVAAGIVRTKRGVGGGVSLARDPSELRLDEVVRILEGSLAPLECVDDPQACTRANSCAVRELWRKVREAVVNVLAATTLQDLAERQKEKDQLKAVMYYI
ncbi:RrF2 family transcriptional regulator [Candidatus Bipolaricaulota sp. J31]